MAPSLHFSLTRLKQSYQSKIGKASEEDANHVKTASSPVHEPPNCLRHQPMNLKAREIRLLQLEYNSNKDQAIVCALVKVNMDDMPIFKALSYTWGPPHPTVEIIVLDSQGPMVIRENLFEFLRVIRSDQNLCETTLFWVDQICIDQSNIEERNHQVAQMSQIYSSAEEVIVWLGLGTTDSNTFMENIAGYPEADRTGIDWESWPLNFVIIEHISYWSRLWIIQELLLARQISIFWGSRQVQWDDLMKVYLEYANNRVTFDKQYQDNLKLSMRINNLRVARYRKFVDGVYRFTWDETLSFFKGSQCEDPRDRIYGLLGLVEDSMKMAPDYRKSLEAVFENMMHRQARYGKYNFSDWKSIGSSWRKELGLGEDNEDWEPMENQYRELRAVTVFP